MNPDLKGKVIAITGAFGTLGLAVAREAVALGAKVALLDRVHPDLQTLPGALDGALCLGGIDLTCQASAQEAFARIATHYGALDGLLNIAGGFRWETLEDGDLASWDLLYNMNVRTSITASKAALALLLQSPAGRIVNIGAGAAVKASIGMGAYAASKAGVARLTESLADELKERGVTVNAVLPSIIDTPQNRIDMPDADFASWVSPRELAAVILFLASDRASAVTGALIPVSGRV
ncbi:SDR family NAD(P)-dependent oxidoreductase [Pseudomonas silvicola]|nr:SDR family NAD(P)-dependent oxidoreductase [Pseudomonas silvicola]